MNLRIELEVERGGRPLRMWIDGSSLATAHIYRSESSTLHPGQDTLFVTCKNPLCSSYQEQWQIGIDRQYDLVEGDKLIDACPEVKALLGEIGYTNMFAVFEDCVEDRPDPLKERKKFERFKKFLSELEKKYYKEQLKEG